MYPYQQPAGGYPGAPQQQQQQQQHQMAQPMYAAPHGQPAGYWPQQPAQPHQQPYPQAPMQPPMGGAPAAGPSAPSSFAPNPNADLFSRPPPFLGNARNFASTVPLPAAAGVKAPVAPPPPGSFAPMSALAGGAVPPPPPPSHALFGSPQPASTPMHPAHAPPASASASYAAPPPPAFGSAPMNPAPQGSSIHPPPQQPPMHTGSHLEGGAQYDNWAAAQMSGQFSNMSVSASAHPAAAMPASSAVEPVPTTILNPRINLTELPRPDASLYLSDPEQPVPLDPCGKYGVVDPVLTQNMQSSSRYIRPTMRVIPNTPSLMTKWTLPFGAIVRPLADEEDPTRPPVPLINFGPSGVVRCRRCRTYINPFVEFTEGGRHWLCNVCKFVNDVNSEYFCPLDERTGIRRDVMQRPELTHGTVEFIAPAEYMVRPPQPPVYFFVLEVSESAISTGFTRKCAETIRSCLDHLLFNSSVDGEVQDISRTRIGIITFDSTVHFYALRSGPGSQPQMYVVADVDDMFAPLPADELLCNLKDCKDAVDSLLDKLSAPAGGLFDKTTNVESCFGAALTAATHLLSPLGGKLCCFLSTLPTLGEGKLKNREDMKAYGTPDKERLLFASSDVFYRDKAIEHLSKNQIAVDLFIAPVASASAGPSSSAAQQLPFMDVANLGTLSRLTGGDIFYYNTSLDSSTFLDRVEKDVRRVLLRTTGLEAVMRIRTSTGLKITHFHGHFFIRGSDLLALPNTDGDKTFGVQFAHTGSTVGSNTVCIQSALLYTTCSGERRIRVSSISLPVTNHMNDMYRHSDVGATVALMAKQGVDDMMTAGPAAARESLQARCINILRLFTSLQGPSSSGSSSSAPPSMIGGAALPSSSSSLVGGRTLIPSASAPPMPMSSSSSSSSSYSTAAGLLCPSSLHLLPIFTLGLVKSTVFRGETDIRADERLSHVARLVSCFGAPESLLYFYPRLFDLLPLTLHEKPSNEMPPLVPLAQECLHDYGIYLLDNGMQMTIWCGRASDPSLQAQLSSADASTPFKLAVNNLIASLTQKRSFSTPLLIVKQGDNVQLEQRHFLRLLPEFPTASNSLSYSAWIEHLMRQMSSPSPSTISGGR